MVAAAILSAALASTLIAAAAAAAADFTTPADLAPHALFPRIASGCSTSGTASCQNATAVKDTCCFEANGKLALVQFWDTDPATGPSNSWTIHGLWPDYCGSGYPQNCDSSRAYTDIASLLSGQGASDTLSFMQTFWKNQGAADEELWEHEWAKHGTCMTTLQTKCLPSGSAKGAEAVAFFKQVVALFKALPTYDWLADAGISPGSKTYSLATLTSAIQSQFGAKPAFDCESGAIYQVSYYYNLKGSVIDGTWLPVDAPAGSCSSSSLKYLTKSGASPAPTTTGGSSPPSTTKTSTAPTGTSTAAVPAKAKLAALLSSGSTTGGLLTAGTWSTQTLATVTISGTGSVFTMATSKGPCGVSTGMLTCGSGVAASTFAASSGAGGNLLLSYGGSAAFSSDGTPSGSTVYTVYTGSARSVKYSLMITAA